MSVEKPFITSINFSMFNPILTTTAKGVVADDFCMSVDGKDSRKVTLVLTETMYAGDPVKAGVILAEDIIRRTDYRTNAEYEEAVAEFERQYPEGLDVNRIPGYARLEKKNVTFIGELTVLGVRFDRSTLIPGLTIPVTYTLKNTGVTRIDTILIDGTEYTISLDPNEQMQIRTICQVIVIMYRDTDIARRDR